MLSSQSTTRGARGASANITAMWFEADICAPKLLVGIVDGRRQMWYTEAKTDRRCQRLVKQNSGGVFTVGEGRAVMENVDA